MRIRKAGLAPRLLESGSGPFFGANRTALVNWTFGSACGRVLRRRVRGVSVSIQSNRISACDPAGVSARGASRRRPPALFPELKLESGLTRLASHFSHHYISGESRGPCHGTLPAIL